jgi:hypothetical protein
MVNMENKTNSSTGKFSWRAEFRFAPARARYRRKVKFHWRGVDARWHRAFLCAAVEACVIELGQLATKLHEQKKFFLVCHNYFSTDARDGR